MEINSNKSISTFGLIMINIIAICSLRSLPFAAEFGWQLLIVYFLATVCFLIPIAFISSFLTSRYKERGGIYLWAKAAFGLKFGFLAIWLQWVYNLLWYPTAMVFVISTFLKACNIDTTPGFILLLTSIFFWIITLANCFGLRISAIISMVGAILGTLLPILILVYFAYDWLAAGRPSHLYEVNIEYGTLPLLVNVMFGLMGLEMSCVHAGEVKNPEKNYPRALIISSILIPLILSLSSIALATVVPNKTLSLLSGVTQAFKFLLDFHHLSNFVPLILLLISIGGLSCIGAWVIGPSKGLQIAAKDGCLPQYFAVNNKYSVPYRLLIIQAILVTVLNLFYLNMPSLEQAYLTLSMASSQLALISYLILIAAAWHLRKSKIPGYKLPGGQNLLIISCIISFITSLLIFLLGFKAPISLHISKYNYDFWLIVSMLVVATPVFFIKNKV